MNSQTDYIEDLRIIKKVMEESSRFLSLSGLSGIFTGLIALAGAACAILFFFNGHILLKQGFLHSYTSDNSTSLKSGLVILAAIILLLAIGTAILFSYVKARRKGLKMWTPVSRRFLINLMVPLVTGALLIFSFYLAGNWRPVIPSMLIFYGLALVGAGKFTYNDIFYLGLTEIITGLCAAFLPVFGIIFWCFGFGILHITYGIIMYRKYER
jgi:hypothetical protein